MPKYPQSAVTAKRGANYIRTIVEDAGSLFIKIEQENDLGIDAIIELIHEGKPLNKQVAVQIKSGQSYYNSDSNECVFPVGNHREYWAKHPLAVYGIVYIPSLKTAHWLELKDYLKNNPEVVTIRFTTSHANRFDELSYNRIFIPKIIHETPTLSIDEAFLLIRSSKLDEAYLGIVVLFRRYPNVLQIWDELIYYISIRPIEEIPPHLVYFLAHIPGHPDIFYFGEQITPATRQYAKSIFSKIGVNEVIKLLKLVDQESSISRGTVGQSVESIISSLPSFEEILLRILDDLEIEMFIKECAVLILAYNKSTSATASLRTLAADGSWYANELLTHIQDSGYINPYA